MAEKVYIKCGGSVTIKKKEVLLEDVAIIWSSDEKMVKKLKKIKLFDIEANKDKKISISVLYIIKAINAFMPDLDVEVIGKEDFVLEYINGKPNPALQALKLILGAGVIFFGSAFAILAYENDIDIKGVFESIYSFVGVDNKSLILEISYSIGIAAGIIVFYNHFAGKKWNNDPTPVVVEMNKYEDDIDSALIDISKRNGEELEV